MRADGQRRSALYLEDEGDYVLEVVEYFRRPTAKGTPALHCRCQVLATLEEDGAWSPRRYGEQVTRPFPLAGPGVAWLGDLLRAVGQEEIDLDPNDDRGISMAIAHQPFRARCKLSKPVPRRDGNGTRRFMNMVQIRSIEAEQWTSLPEHCWQQNRPNVPSHGVRVADPRDR